jgi:spore germination protein (amino acid permease)
MKQKGFISTSQYIWMLFSIITSFTALEITGLLIQNAGRASWLSVAGAWFLDVTLAIVYAYMGIRFPGQNMVQYSMTIFGKVIGRVVGIMFPLFFLLSVAFLMRSLTILINRLFMPKTPTEVLLAISYILIAYGVFKGIETLARTCQFLGPIYLFSMIILFALLVPKIKLHRLKPLMDQGPYPIMTGIPFILSFIGICIIMGMYIPICNRPEKGFIGKLIAVSMGASVIGLLVLFSVGAFGAEQAGNMINPAFQLVRLANIGDFVERVEIILLLLSIAAGIMASANLVWATSVGISQIVGLNNHKPLIIPVTLIAFITNVTSFKESIQAFRFIFYTFFLVGLFVEVVLEMLLFFGALILKKDARPKKATSSK